MVARLSRGPRAHAIIPTPVQYRLILHGIGTENTAVEISTSLDNRSDIHCPKMLHIAHHLIYGRDTTKEHLTSQHMQTTYIFKITLAAM